MEKIAAVVDAAKAYPRVNHDILMGLIAKRVADKRILRLIRGFLTASVVEGGLVAPTEEGIGALHLSNLYQVAGCPRKCCTDRCFAGDV